MFFKDVNDHHNLCFRTKQNFYASQFLNFMTTPLDTKKYQGKANQVSMIKKVHDKQGPLPANKTFPNSIKS